MKLDAPSLTTETAKSLLGVGDTALSAGDLTLDLSAVTQVDSAAVALLLHWQRSAQAVEKRFEFVSVPEALCSLATLYGVDALLGTPPAEKATALTAIHPDAAHSVPS